MNKAIKKAEVDSCCFSFILLGSKSAVHKLNPRMQFAAGVRVNSDSVGVLRAGVAVEEAV